MVRCRILSLALSLSALAILAFPARADQKVVKAFTERSSEDLAALIDREVQKRLDQEKAPRGDAAADAEFFRRLWLDLGGRVPRVSEVREFLDDKSPAKRKQAVEDLLGRAEHVEHFANVWQTTFTPTTANNQALFFGNNLRNWLLDRVRARASYKDMARGLLSPPTPPAQDPQRGFINANVGPSAAFFQFNESKPENLASSASRIFLGVRLECAQCHDHPFAKWEMDQFWQQAAFFADAQVLVRPAFQRIQPPVPVNNVPQKSIKVPGKNRTVQAKFLDGADPVWQDNLHPVQVFVDWMTADANPYFARTAANRIWAHFFGIGLNDPVDDEPTAESPISHPELLHELTRQLVAHDYDVNYLVRAITASRTYQTTSKAPAKAAEPRLFARMAVRGLTADQLYASLATATGHRDGRAAPGRFQFGQFGGMKGEVKAKFTSTDRPTEAQTSILQALFMMNGKLTADATSLDKSATLAALADAPFLTTEQRIEALYLASLSRLPREEAARLTAYVNAGGPRRDSRAALGDVFWALLNSSEFILNH